LDESLEILNQEFLQPLGLTANALAKAIGVPPNRIRRLEDERGITGDTGIRLGTFKASAEGLDELQICYDPHNTGKALPARLRKSIKSALR
jgi:addiction module HigA family antidote